MPQKDGLEQETEKAVETLLMQSLIRADVPGHTVGKPVSSADRSQKELTKLVLSMVILWLSWDAKLQQIYQSARRATGYQHPSAEEGAFVTDVGSGNDVRSDFTSTGTAALQYKDIEVGEGLREVQSGDSVKLTYTLFYNGMVVVSATDSSIFVVGSGSGGQVAVTGKSVSANQFLPEKGVSAALEGMRPGGRRRAMLPPELAFGDAGLPPFVPPGAKVVFELNVESVC